MATTPVFLPGGSHGQSLAGSSPWGHKQSDTTEWLSLSLRKKCARDQGLCPVDSRQSQRQSKSLAIGKAWWGRFSHVPCTNRPSDMPTSKQFIPDGSLCSWQQTVNTVSKKFPAVSPSAPSVSGLYLFLHCRVASCLQLTPPFHTRRLLFFFFFFSAGQLFSDIGHWAIIIRYNFPTTQFHSSCSLRYNYEGCPSTLYLPTLYFAGRDGLSFSIKSFERKPVGTTRFRHQWEWELECPCFDRHVQLLIIYSSRIYIFSILLKKAENGDGLISCAHWEWNWFRISSALQSLSFFPLLFLCKVYFSHSMSNKFRKYGKYRNYGNS